MSISEEHRICHHQLDLHMSTIFKIYQRATEPAPTGTICPRHMQGMQIGQGAAALDVVFVDNMAGCNKPYPHLHS